MASLTEAFIDKNDLGLMGPYEKFLQTERIPVVKGFFVEDIRKVEVSEWDRMGGLGSYLNLEGADGINNTYICEIPPGRSLKPQKHLFEELIYIVGGQGATTVWGHSGNSQTFEWQEGSLFSPPLNSRYQHFNGQGDRPARLLAMTNAPLIINLFHNLDFVFGCDFAFIDRYNEEEDYFSGKGKALSELFWETNLIQDVRSLELKERKWRASGEKMRHLEIANNVISAHISQFPVGTYKKAHRHGPGAHVVVLQGEGYSLMWPEGKEAHRFDWQEGSLFVPPENWFHQHFNVGAEPTKYLAMKPFTSRKYPGLLKRFGIFETIKRNDDQIEHEDEDPRVLELFEQELARKGIRNAMGEVVNASKHSRTS